jgi:hypothetical protein
MVDDGGDALDQLVTDLLGRALEHVMAVPANGWAEVLREWDEFTALEIVGIVEELDESELRGLAAHLLQRLTGVLRSELLEETFPTLRLSET